MMWYNNICVKLHFISKTPDRTAIYWSILRQNRLFSGYVVVNDNGQ